MTLCDTDLILMAICLLPLLIAFLVVQIHFNTILIYSMYAHTQ
jgi:hypothetical protein